MSTPRDHHFLPVFYLKRWVSVFDRKLSEYTIKHGRFISKRIGPRATGYETDLYSFPELPQDASQYLERVVFQASDNRASIALARHLKMEMDPWPATLRSAWSEFIMSMILRHPDVMKELRVAAKSLWDKGSGATQRGYEAIRKPTDPETFEEYMAEVDPLIEVKARLNMIIRALNNAIIGTHLNQMKWAVVDVTASPNVLLTSDRPVIIYRLRDPDGSLFLPISPIKLFVAANEQKTIDQLANSSPSDIVKKANELVVQRARRYVFSRDTRQEEFIKKNMSTNMEATPLFPNLDRSDDDQLSA